MSKLVLPQVTKLDHPNFVDSRFFNTYLIYQPISLDDRDA